MSTWLGFSTPARSSCTSKSSSASGRAGAGTRWQMHHASQSAQPPTAASLASQHRSWSLRRRLLLACDAQHVSKILSLWGGPAFAQAGAVAEESLQLSQLSLQGSSGGVGLGEVGSLAGMMASMRHCGGRGALIQCCSRSVQLQPPRRHPTLASAVGHCSAARLAPNTCPCRAMSASGCSSGSCMAARPCRCGCVKQVHEPSRFAFQPPRPDLRDAVTAQSISCCSGNGG